jgi:hypothetical protein
MRTNVGITKFCIAFLVSAGDTPTPLGKSVTGTWEQDDLGTRMRQLRLNSLHAQQILLLS